jgi:hypothetical protein
MTHLVGDKQFTRGFTHLGDDKSPLYAIYSFIGAKQLLWERIMSQKREMDECVYQIRVQGRIEAQWTSWLNGMTITQESEEPPVSRISGRVIDQAKLRGIINQLWDLNLTLISVNRLE